MILGIDQFTVIAKKSNTCFCSNNGILKFQSDQEVFKMSPSVYHPLPLAMIDSFVPQSPKKHAMKKDIDHPGLPIKFWTEPKKSTRKHNGVRARSVPCHYCGKTFGRERDLLRHQDSVHNCTKILYECWCGLSFPRKDSLQRHIKRKRTSRCKILDA